MAPEQRSSAVTAVDGMASPHSSVVSAGRPEKAGAVSSTTVTAWMAWLKLPQASMAVKVRMSVYWLAHVPACVVISSVRSTVPQASLAVGMGKSYSSSQLRVTSAGRFSMAGAVVSSMV